MLFSLALFFLPTTTAAAADKLPKISTLEIITGGKAKQLRLQWSPVSGATGYQFLRSTTGKPGSYAIIAATEGKTTYTDAGLKDSTPYYYAVRACADNGGRISYGAAKKGNLSTRITKSYACKRFRQVWKVMDKIWSSIIYPEDYLENFERAAFYYPITFKG